MIHVGCSNGTIIAQLNYVDDFKTCTITTSEVGLLLARVLRREAKRSLCLLFSSTATLTKTI